MNIQPLLDRLPTLTDLELAVLLSLTAQQHCLITTEDELLDDLAAELSLIVSEVFGLSYAVISREDQVSVDKFGEAIVVQDQASRQPSFADLADVDSYGNWRHRPSLLANVHFRAGSRVDQQQELDTRMVVNVVIAKDFNFAPRDVQVAALELIKNRRIFSRTTVHPVPKVFLFLPLLSSSEKHYRLNDHLNDNIFISHTHDPADGFANLEELETQSVLGGNSGYSTPKSPISAHSNSSKRIDLRIVDELRTSGKAASITPEIRRYIQDVIVFLRMERGVDGGITAAATDHFVGLSKYLAPLHGIGFVTPDLVDLAARKVYPHRMVIANPGRERSMQYGSDTKAVTELLTGLTADEIIETVLRRIQCPR